ncbi:cAMP-dependent protein kinase regulator [Aureococcus anophagefferens]|nr:cAMP-dependent protein kinase regulator [Aureococcus anophagefferens]
MAKVSPVGVDDLLRDRIAPKHAVLFDSAVRTASNQSPFGGVAPFFELRTVKRGSIFARNVMRRDDLYFVVGGEVDLVVKPEEKKKGRFSALFGKTPEPKVLKQVGRNDIMGMMELVQSVDARKTLTASREKAHQTDVVVPRRTKSADLLVLSVENFLAMRDGAEATAKAFCGNVDRMSRTSTIEWLGKTSFLQSLSHPQLELVSSIARFKSCVPEQTVIEQGAPTRAFYIVLHGNLRVTCGAPRQKSRLVVERASRKISGGGCDDAPAHPAKKKKNSISGNLAALMGKHPKPEEDEAAGARLKEGEVVVGAIAQGGFFGESSLLDALAAVAAPPPTPVERVTGRGRRSSLAAGGRGLAGSAGEAETRRVTERLPRATASVVATEETLLLVFDAIEFVTAISEYPEAATQVQDAVKLRMAGQLQTLALPIFASFDTHQLSLFTQTMKVTTFAAGTHIFEFGDSGEDFYILLQGEITIIGEDGKPLVTLHEKGDYFGEVALIRSEPRSASVVTATSATVAVVKGATFRDLFLTSPAAAAEFEIKAMREKASAAAVLTHPSTAPLFKAVYDAYVDQASETCVNISHKLVRQLKKRVVEAGPADAPLDADAFEGVEAEINKMLKGNMMRFCNQDEYKIETKGADVEAKDARRRRRRPRSVPALAVPAADGEPPPRTPPATPDGHQAVLGGGAGDEPQGAGEAPALAGLGDQPSTRIVLDPRPRDLPAPGN